MGLYTSTRCASSFCYDDNDGEGEGEPSIVAINATANTYSRCEYTQCDYYKAFKACAKKIRAYDKRIRIHANSATGQLGASPVANDPETLDLVWVWWYIDVVMWWCGGMVVWWCGGMVMWWYGGMVVWWCGGVVVWWYGGVVVWWYGVWCGLPCAVW
jgi:hypothetical protein